MSYIRLVEKGEESSDYVRGICPINGSFACNEDVMRSAPRSNQFEDLAFH